MLVIPYKKTITGIGLFMFLVLLVPLTVFLVRQQQTTGSSAAEIPIATYNGVSIFKSDLSNLAAESYSKSPENLNAAQLKSLLNTYVEQKILDSQNLGDISKELATAQSQGFIGSSAKYEALKQKLIETRFKSWKLYSIDFWLPQQDDLSKADSKRQQESADVKGALDFAKAQMEKGVSVYDIAGQIKQKFSSIYNILGVNSYQFKDSSDPSAWDTPTTYYYAKDNKDTTFYKTLYGMNEQSPVTEILSEANMGGSVIKIVKVNNPDGITDNYEDWLSSQESSFVITDSALKSAN